MTEKLTSLEISVGFSLRRHKCTFKVYMRFRIGFMEMIIIGSLQCGIASRIEVIKHMTFMILCVIKKLN